MSSDFGPQETFCVTYADGLADIDLGSLLDFHRAHGALATMTVVRPELQFGVTELDGAGRVTGFREKPRSEHWINGGFFCFSAAALERIAAAGDDIPLERAPLEALARGGELRAYRHEGFWACMDTYKDAVALNDLWASGAPPWRVWPEDGRAGAGSYGVRRRARNSGTGSRMPRQAALAGEGPAVGLRRAVVQRALGQQAARARDRGDAAREVDRPPEPVARARQREAERRTGAQLREVLALGVGRVDQPEGGAEQRLRLGRGEHGGVADRLDQPHGRLGDLAGERFQAHREPSELVRRDFLAEAREADEVGEADRDLARAG